MKFQYVQGPIPLSRTFQVFKKREETLKDFQGPVVTLETEKATASSVASYDTQPRNKAYCTNFKYHMGHRNHSSTKYAAYRTPFICGILCNAVL